MNRKKIKQTLIAHSKMTKFVRDIYNYLPFNNRIRIKANNHKKICGFMKNTKINICGTNNQLVVGNMSRHSNCRVTIKGNNNKVIIGDDCFITEGDFFIEDDNGTICIGSDTTICGYTHMAVIEGEKISIGDNCLFSANITIRTGDSHSIIACDSQKRINISKSVSIKDNVWIGNQVTILKGVEVSEHSVIGTGTLLTKTFLESNVILAGNPAKIIKRNIDWKGERVNNFE